MSQYTLTVVDTTGIQDYIFGTNQLRQNVGASYLVECATRKWAVEALPEPHNVTDLDSEVPFTEQTIEDGQLAAEVIYAGGGNTVILFNGHDDAIAFARRLTRTVLTQAPGLQVVLVHKDFDWQKEALGGEKGIIAQAMTNLTKKKADHLESSPILGLGITAACAFTGLPAVPQDIERHLISAEVKAKLDAESEANRRLLRLFNFGDHGVDHEPARDFDDFGRTKGESSYIAVIHTDGNGMGQRIQRNRSKFPEASENRDYIRAMRRFSISVQLAASEALQSTIERLFEMIQHEDDGDYMGKNKEIRIQDNKLPFRPIVFGGDDVTFVCDGRLGLSLAAYYLKQFCSHQLADGAPAHCRAGIAVVKTHYPFARAYTLAEELCNSAKVYIKKRQQPPYDEDGLTAMDWHFAVSGLVRDLSEVRDLEYSEGSLLMRPIRVTDPERHWPSWSTFRRIVKEFQTGDQWVERRNKVMGLREALRSGPESVKHFLAVYNVGRLPPIAHQPDMESRGWQGGRCGYFDAIEAMDFFVPLEGEEP